MTKGWVLIAAFCTLMAPSFVQAEPITVEVYSGNIRYQAIFSHYCRYHRNGTCLSFDYQQAVTIINQMGPTFRLGGQWTAASVEDKMGFLDGLVRTCSGPKKPRVANVLFGNVWTKQRCEGNPNYIVRDENNQNNPEGNYEQCDSACPTAARAADAACGANVRTITGLATVAPVLAPLLNKPESVRDACESQQKLTKLVTAMNGAFLASCGTTYLACINSCDAARKNPNCGPIRGDANAAYSRCSNYDVAVGQATQQTLFSGIQLSMVLSCGSDSKAAKQIANFCDENPSSQACTEQKVGAGPDCSDPDTAASDPACICADPEVARVTPVCSENKVGQKGQPGHFNTSLGSSGRGLLESSGLTDLLSGSGFNGAPVEGGAVGVDANQSGAGGGSGPQALGGPSAGLGKKKRGHGKGPYNTDIMKGVGKKGGGGRGAAGMFPGGFMGYGTADESHLEGMDLSKFLPQGEGGREVSGMSVQATDGITGPMGPSIWQKVSSRYKKVQGFLKP